VLEYYRNMVILTSLALLIEGYLHPTYLYFMQFYLAVKCLILHNVISYMLSALVLINCHFPFDKQISEKLKHFSH